MPQHKKKTYLLPYWFGRLPDGTVADRTLADGTLADAAVADGTAADRTSFHIRASAFRKHAANWDIRHLETSNSYGWMRSEKVSIYCFYSMGIVDLTDILHSYLKASVQTLRMAFSVPESTSPLMLACLHFSVHVMLQSFERVISFSWDSLCACLP